HLPLSTLSLRPTFLEECDFGFSTDQRCQPSRHRHIETPPGSTCLKDAVHVDGLSHTSERLCSQVLALEIALHQAIRRVTDGHRIRRSQSLYPCSNVRCFPQGKVFLPVTVPHSPNHGQTCMYPYTHDKLDTSGLLQTGIEVAHGRKRP